VACGEGYAAGSLLAGANSGLLCLNGPLVQRAILRQ
jgi:hypothetical protein